MAKKKDQVQNYDSNEAKASGSRSLQITSTGAQGLIGCVASFAPAPDVANSLFYQQI